MEKKIISFCLIIIKGNGTQRCSYLNDAGLPIWMWTILFKGQSRRAYNVDSEESFSIADMAGQEAGQLQPDPRIEINNRSIPGKRMDSYVPSVYKAQIEKEGDKKIDFQESIFNTIKWYRLMI